MLLDLNKELVVDLFAGGGGASTGIEMALGRHVDIAVNHDPAALAMHEMNHPQTHHDRSDVFEVDPHEITQGRPVGLLWASPDCTYFSKALGGKPLRDNARKRRALAWVVKRWAGQVRPCVIMLENVEEFQEWGPLVGPPDKLRPCPKRKGSRFRAFVRSLERMGYRVEWKERRSCSYSDPTIRKRLYMIARCDGDPIVWPAPSHGPGTRRAYRTAANCIDWAIPMPSIFLTPEEAREWGRAMRAAGYDVGTPKRPLAEATMRRIARGVVRFVLDNPEPFIVGVGGRMGQSAPRSVQEPYQTITAKGDAALVVPYLVPRYGERAGQEPRTRDIQEPMPVIVPTGNGASLVAAFLAQHNAGFYNGAGRSLNEPMSTILNTGSHQSIVAAHLATYYGGPDTDRRGADLREPLHTQTTENRHALVYAFMQAYYGQGIGQSPAEPMRTIPTVDRFGLVTVTVEGTPYVITDIAMRMLQPRELYRAQGFPDSYIIDRGADGRKLTKAEQTRMVGNSVSPGTAAALVRANLPELIVRDDALRHARRTATREEQAA